MATLSQDQIPFNAIDGHFCCLITRHFTSLVQLLPDQLPHLLPAHFLKILVLCRRENGFHLGICLVMYSLDLFDLLEPG